MIAMPQLYQHEIFYRAHGESGHQGVGKVLTRIQERHTWPVIKRDVVNNFKHCLICQRNPYCALERINYCNFDDLVQIDETKLAHVQKVKLIGPVPIAINTPGVDMKFGARVVLEGHFLQGFYRASKISAAPT